MDTKNLQEHHQELIAHMQQMGYSQNYIQQIRREIRLILDNPDRWNSYEEIILSYEQQFDTKKAGQSRAKVRLIARFDLDGKLPRDSDHPKDWSYYDNAYQHLNNEFSGLINYYRSNVDSGAKKETTIYNECCNTAAFLYQLQTNGISSLCQIDQDVIINSLINAEGLPSKSASYFGQILSVFRGSNGYSVECGRIAQILPVVRKRRKNIQYLKPDERSSIKSVLKDENSGLCFRDRAIGSLLYYTGLRCSDISNLRFSDIDWDKEELSIQQQKTDVPMKLPLTAVVGNALYDYIVNERGDSKSEYIFLSQNYPFGKMTSGAVSGRTYPIFKAANIRTAPGDRRGGHIFRHNFATSMLENGASRAVISKALGHTSPDSAEVYLSADMVHLKECALSIEAFPVRKGVFASERI